MQEFHDSQSTKNSGRIIDECLAGNIDHVITKSIRRVARNTLDCHKYIRQLKKKNIPFYFEKENINSMDSKGEVMLTIMASLAQQESQSLSQNVKLALQYRYQQGEIQDNCKWFLGYTKQLNNSFVDFKQSITFVVWIFSDIAGATFLNFSCSLLTYYD